MELIPNRTELLEHSSVIFMTSTIDANITLTTQSNFSVFTRVTTEIPSLTSTIKPTATPKRRYCDKITKEPYQETPFDIFYLTTIVTICIVSLTGCVLTFILMCSKKYANRSFSVYFRFLALSDCLCMVAMGLMDFDMWLFLTMRLEMSWEWLFFYHDMITIALSMESITKITSAWYLVAVTADRFISILYPNARFRCCTKCKAWGTCIIIGMVAIIIEIGAIFAFEEIHEIRYKGGINGTDLNFTHFLEDDVRAYEFEDIHCLFEEVWNLTGFITGYYVFMNIVLCLLIPVPLVLVMTSRIIAEIHRILRDVSADAAIDAREITRVRQASYGLAVVGLASAVTLTPVLVSETVEAVMMFMSSGMVEFAESLATMWRVFHLIRMLNYSFNFYVLVCTGRVYREDMKRICKCRRVDEEPETVMYTVYDAAAGTPTQQPSNQAV